MVFISGSSPYGWDKGKQRSDHWTIDHKTCSLHEEGSLSLSVTGYLRGLRWWFAIRYRWSAGQIKVIFSSFIK
jgi:hypothetical protein